jgi:hypothetical protein
VQSGSNRRAGCPPCATADQVQIGNQSNDGQSTRCHHPAATARYSRRSDRIKTPFAAARESLAHRVISWRCSKFGRFRSEADIQQRKARGNLSDGHRGLTSGHRARSPRWHPSSPGLVRVNPSESPEQWTALIKSSGVRVECRFKVKRTRPEEKTNDPCPTGCVNRHGDQLQ